MKHAWIAGCLISVAAVAAGEDIFRESFEGAARKDPLVRTWGDEPTAVALNATEPKVGADGSAAAHLRLEFPAKVKHNLSYWTYNLPERVPLVPQLETISFRVRTNVPVSIKIGISPYGFIYHGPGVGQVADRHAGQCLHGAQELVCEGEEDGRGRLGERGDRRGAEHRRRQGRSGRGRHSARGA